MRGSFPSFFLGRRRPAALNYLLAAIALASTSTALRAEEEGFRPLTMNELQINQLVQMYYGNDLRNSESVLSFCVTWGDRSYSISSATSEDDFRNLLDRLPEVETEQSVLYQFGQRWTTTAVTGVTTARRPITITYSFIPDGTLIPGDPDIGNATTGSELFSLMNNSFPGGENAWKARIGQVFQRWGELTAITYLEVSDDGAPFPTSPGAVGARGDVRIGMHLIDGSSDILAYNFFPNNGDMVLDSGDLSFYTNQSQGFRAMRNILAHEHGHGLGYFHVLPINQTKLMEPFLSVAFDGPQQDDIRGAQFTYGDPYEFNNTREAATDLGFIPLGGSSRIFGNMAMETRALEDWYRFVVPAEASMSVVVRPVGTTYLQGPQFGGELTQVEALSIHNLRFELIDAVSNEVTDVSGGPIGSQESVTGVVVPGPGPREYFVRVQTDSSTQDIQRYELVIQYNGGIEPTPSPTASPVPTASPEPTASPTVSPTASPTPTPFVSPSPTNVPGPQPPLVTWNFTQNIEGWSFIPVVGVSSGNSGHTPGTSPEGTLNIRTGNQSFSFGFWESPLMDLDSSNGSALADPNQVYRAIFSLRSDQIVSADTPTARLRVTAEDASQADVLVVESTGAARYSPTAFAPRDYSLYFTLAEGAPRVRFAMDLLNVNNGAPGSSLRLDRLSVESVNAFAMQNDLRLEAGYDFSNGTQGWEYRSISSAEFFAAPGGTLPGALTLSTAGSGLTQYASWNGPENPNAGAVLVEPSRLYFGIFTVESSLLSPNDVPSFRMRFNESAFEAAQLTQASSNFFGSGPARNMPTAGNPKSYRVFFPSNAAVGRVLFPSFDLLSTTGDFDSQAATLQLNSVLIYSVLEE